MVPGTGTKSNSKHHFLTAWNKNNKALISELETALPEQAYEELFSTLADWNDYLENHTPYFKEPQP